MGVPAAVQPSASAMNRAHRMAWHTPRRLPAHLSPTGTLGQQWQFVLLCCAVGVLELMVLILAVAIG